MPPWSTLAMRLQASGLPPRLLPCEKNGRKVAVRGILTEHDVSQDLHVSLATTEKSTKGPC